MQFLEAREGFGGTTIGDAVFLMGGCIHKYHCLSNGEVIQSGKPSFRVKLPFKMANVVLVKITDMLIYVIGGFQFTPANDDNHSISADVWALHPSDNFTMYKKPSMKVPRVDHNCANIEIQKKEAIICAGGRRFHQTHDTMEYLILDEINKGWTIGNYLKVPFSDKNYLYTQVRVQR